MAAVWNGCGRGSSRSGWTTRWNSGSGSRRVVPTSASPNPPWTARRTICGASCVASRCGNLWGSGWTIARRRTIRSGIDSIEVMVAKLREFPGWPVYKIKLGTPDDLAIVAALRAHTDAVFRVDANCGWTAEETIRNSAGAAAVGRRAHRAAAAARRLGRHAAVYAQSALPVMADESCRTESDVDRCQGFFHGINIKLVKCGGLCPARRMIDRARQLGLRVMAGCMCESTVGISAVAQLLPLLDYADMDGARLLGRDIAEGVHIERGRAQFPHTGGCGITLRGRRNVLGGRNLIRPLRKTGLFPATTRLPADHVA